jgi:hypothetical protein
MVQQVYLRICELAMLISDQTNSHCHGIDEARRWSLSVGLGYYSRLRGVMVKSFSPDSEKCRVHIKQANLILPSTSIFRNESSFRSAMFNFYSMIIPCAPENRHAKLESARVPDADQNIQNGASDSCNPGVIRIRCLL